MMMMRSFLLIHLLLPLIIIFHNHNGSKFFVSSSNIHNYKNVNKRRRNNIISINSNSSSPPAALWHLRAGGFDNVIKRHKISVNVNITNKKNKSAGASSNDNKNRNKPISFLPLYSHEYPRFLCTSILMFLFIIIFTMTRDTKDSLIVSNCGAEAIPFLKLYGVMPAAALFLVYYSKLSSWISSKSVLFYVTLLPFFVFYGVFAFVLYPMRDVIHWTSSSSSSNPIMCLLQNWSYALYFIVTELYAGAGVPLLFWQFANHVTPLEQAKRFYPLLPVIGNMAPLTSGKIMSAVLKQQQGLDEDVGFGMTLKKLALIKIGTCGLICVLYSMINRMPVEGDTKTSIAQTKPQHKKSGKKKGGNVAVKTKKPTLRESVVELSKNKELRSIATMVIGYNVCIELTEVLWKGILKTQYPVKSEYMAFMARFSQIVGAVSTVLQVVASILIRKFGWKIAALTPPITMGIFAILFFLSVSVGTEVVPLKTALMIGTVQNVISKVTKYSIFDPCKEMTYIPLGPEAKVKGKAGIEVLASRVGRSVGSASQQLMVLLSGGSILSCAPALGMMFVGSITAWINAVDVLSELFCLESAEDSKSSSVKKKKN